MCFRWPAILEATGVRTCCEFAEPSAKSMEKSLGGQAWR